MTVSAHHPHDLSIGEIAERAGIRPSAIRYYESIGILPPAERISGQRRYDERVLQLLAVIDTGQSVGLSLEEIGALLQASRDGAVGAKVRALAERRLPEVEALIVRAQAVKRWLEAAEACRCPELEDCPLFDGSVSLPLGR